MKQSVCSASGFLLAAILLAAPLAARAQDNSQKYEYITIRWDGVDRTCVIMAEGKVQFFGDELKSFTRPDDVDKRAFYMTIVMNRMAKQGYEFVSLISDEIVMKRGITH